MKFYDKQIDETKQAITKLIEKDPILKPRIEQLCKIKGLGLLTVATIVAETNGFTGFENIRQLVSFAGYDVVENQSGNRVGKTRISKKGNSRIRRILHLPAFNAVRFGEPTCQALFERVFERTKIQSHRRTDEGLRSRPKKVTNPLLCHLEKQHRIQPKLQLQQCQRTPKSGQKNSPDRRDYTGYSCLKQPFQFSPKIIKKS